MKYRIVRLNDDKFCITDVLQTSEKLFKRNDIFYGINYQEIMSARKLFKRFTSPSKESYLLDISLEGDKLQSQYAEVIEGRVVFRRDTFELVNFDIKMSKKLDKYIKGFKKDKPKRLKTTAKRILAKCNLDDPFACSADFINEVSHHPKDIKIVSREKAQSLYSYMVNLSRFQGIDLIKYVPMNRVNKDKSWLKEMVVEFILGFTIIPAILYLSTKGSYDIASLLLVSFIAYTTVSIDKDDKYALSCQEAYYDRLLVDMANEYGLDLQQVINKGYAKCADPSFVDFIMADLEYNEKYIKSPKINALLVNLGEDYSNSKKREDIFGGRPIDRERYMKVLLDIEMALYSSNKRNGLLEKGSIAINKGNILDRLRYLGWSSEEITSNFYIKEIIDAFERISACPYEGCEVELQALVKLAVQMGYKNSKLDLDYESLYETIGNIEDAANYKLAQATELENLAVEVEKLEKNAIDGQEPLHDKTIKFNPIKKSEVNE